MAIIVGQSYWHSLFSYQLGQTAPGGGNLICCSGGIFWIVAPDTSEVSRTWDNREDAVTTATACTNATGWFIPTSSELSNPGFACRTYWDSYSSTWYWSNTIPYGVGWAINLANGALCQCCPNSTTLCVRAFRCVIY